MNLVIVESPTKARTLSRFLGPDYTITATMGHIRDLPEKKLGVEIKPRAKNQEPKNGRFEFIPQYVLVAKKKEAVGRLKQEARRAKRIILATDPDREGEAIAYHVAVICSNEKSKMTQSASRRIATPVKRDKNEKILRIVFHEITESALKEALANPRQIDMNLVDAQQARRVLDRLVGYKLSPLLWRKIRRGLSAGRVQSVTVRLIVEREREIEKFKKEEYWRIFTGLTKDGQVIVFELIKFNGEKLEERQTFSLFDGEYTVSKTKIKTQEEAERIVKKFEGLEFRVINVEASEFERTPPPPFTTSTLQQEANRRLGFSGKQTMVVAQRLYEEGKITYHRTDSVTLSSRFLAEAQRFIKKTYGKDFALDYFRRYQTKQRLAQEAHEAIRPTDAREKPIEKGKTEGERLYDLIWRRAVATQMRNARFKKTVVTVSAGQGEFVVGGVEVLFPGFLILYPEMDEDKILPSLAISDVLKLVAFCPTQKFTEPPPRYTEAALIKALEEKGIGRPSTYAPIISTIQERQYVEKIERKFSPTVLGRTVNDFLVENFPDIVKVEFTAKMEDKLDGIARGETKWGPVLSDFYGPFEKTIEQVYSHSARVQVPVEETTEICEKCGAPLVIRIGRFGKFLACSKFPECKFTRSYINKTGLRCPNCGGEIILKRSKKGRSFYGCINYPTCNFAAWRKEQIISRKT